MPVFLIFYLRHRAVVCREALGVQMPAINIFRDRTIVNVAERIRQNRRRKKAIGQPRKSHGYVEQ